MCDNHFISLMGSLFLGSPSNFPFCRSCFLSCPYRASSSSLFPSYSISCPTTWIICHLVGNYLSDHCDDHLLSQYLFPYIPSSSSLGKSYLDAFSSSPSSYLLNRGRCKQVLRPSSSYKHLSIICDYSSRVT